MSEVTMYSSKSTAVRGVVRMGVAADRAAEFVVRKETDEGVKFLVVREAVTEWLRQQQRGSEVVAGADKGDVAGNVTSNDAKEQMTQAEIDEDLETTCGFSHCPSCGIHLSNGLMDYDSLADQKGEKEAYGLQKHQWSCMGCNAEWGSEIEAPKGARKTPSRHYLNRSTIDGAVSASHAIYDANPDARRKDAIQAAVDAGIAFYTARTQYQKWFKAKKTLKAK